MTALRVPLSESPVAELKRRFQANLKLNESLGPHTTFGIGGPADFFIRATDPETFLRALNAARELGLPCFVIGGGSNVLVSDEGFRGLAIKSDLTEMIQNDCQIMVGSGVTLDTLVDWAAERNLAGLAFAAGIGGSVGGAVYGNAGCYGQEIGELVAELAVVTLAGDLKVVDQAYCGFRYRHSRLKETGDIVLTVTLQLRPGDSDQLRAEAEGHRQERRERHPTVYGSAGCFFKNIEDPTAPHGKIAAGRLLDQVGAKTETQGGAAVHSGHANILINKGGATARDVMSLAGRLRRRVRDRFGYELAREIIFLGPHGPEPEHWED
jgi:UDP-N-acetylmuramate dehydrogenase